MQQLREGQLVGRMLLQRLATGATGVNKRDTGEGQRQAYSARHSYAHAQYIHNASVLLLNSAEGFAL